MKSKKTIWLCDQDCNHCAVIHNRQVSLLMNVLWIFHGETVPQIANKICPNMTCCADCRIDDMTHMEGCEIYQEAKKIVNQLCREDRSIATIHAIMESVDNLAGDLMEARMEVGIELEESKEAR